eukprot:TRINITY_DN760_c0_g1_i1.p1 TRINITY_DN760_c0_g1~~TRINITY_DN760_c0_g1_i1.p1  ORF type:complete len:435 (+),score=66.67 TRINITY_DN760_c0_g1_i1:132-1436(+)
MVDRVAVLASFAPFSLPSSYVFQPLGSVKFVKYQNYKLDRAGSIQKFTQLTFSHSQRIFSTQGQRSRVLSLENFPEVKLNMVVSKGNAESCTKIIGSCSGNESLKSTFLLCKEGINENIFNPLSLLMCVKYLASIKDGIEHSELKGTITKLNQSLQICGMQESSGLYFLHQNHPRDVFVSDLSDLKSILSIANYKKGDFHEALHRFVLDHFHYNSNVVEREPDCKTILFNFSSVDHEVKTSAVVHHNAVIEVPSQSMSSQIAKDPGASTEDHKLKNSLKKKNKKSLKKERDIFKKSSFQNYEFIISLLFDKEFKISNILELTKSSRQGVEDVLNQMAVTIAGGGIGIMMVAASKMFVSNATFDSRKVINVIFGFGLIWLSNGLQNLKNAVSSLKNMNQNFKPKQKQGIDVLKRELSHVFFKAFSLVAFTLVRFA